MATLSTALQPRCQLRNKLSTSNQAEAKRTGLVRRRWLGGELRDRGAVAVEFALIFPVFLFMILFMLDAGRYLTVQMALNNAAEVGARSVAQSDLLIDTQNATVNSVPEGILRLSTLDATTVNGLGVREFVCAPGSENLTFYNTVTGSTDPAPNDGCTDISFGSGSALTCSYAAANFRAMARVSLTFKWITPLGLIINLANPNDVGPGNSIYTDRNDTDTTIIEGKVKLLCLN